ncbi:hypothetical protein DPMN_000752 [Dreissena polymorpha]|uniref:Uncharacterized protein n=1 Tax=Dreissena polymorpha TaxID=45954 RepID=A0A9D4RSB2_DREPO|nr:hypothetical protein DPMN_000752 [Dreissena polymorpha]
MMSRKWPTTLKSPYLSTSQMTKTYFRMTRGTFERVLERISTDDQLRRRIATGGREQVPLDKDLLTTLWYLGNLDTVRSNADRFNVSKSTFLDHNRRMLTV